MGFIAWIVVGGLAGWLASMAMGTNGNQGCLMNVVLGVVGAFVGGYVLNFIGIGAQVSGINIASIFTAFVGAVVVLFLKNQFT